MFNQLCPTCGTSISLVKSREIEQQLKKERSEVEASVGRQLEERHRREIQAAQQLAEKRVREEANKRVAAVSAECQKLQQKAKQLEAREVTVKRQAQEEANKRVAVVSVERDKLQLKAKQLEAREAVVRKNAQDEATRRIKQAQEEAARQNKKEILEQRRILEKHRDSELLKQQAVFSREREAYQKTVKEMERRLQRKTANELGDGAEIDLFEALREAFPEDRITRIQKGKPGADILHEVSQRGQCCGRIIYDSKNHQQWRVGFATKLRQDQKDCDAEYAVLSTMQFPGGEKGICHQGGVIVVGPANVVQVVRVLRGSILKVHQLGLSVKERATKMSRLYAFITSEKFIQRLSMATQLTGEMEELDVQEKRSHDNVWRQRGVLHKRLGGVIAEIDTDILAIVEGVQMRPAA